MEERSGITTKNQGDRLIAFDSSGGSIFEIRIKGHLNDSWSEWLEGLDLKYLVNGEMILFGSIADQAALIGILNKLVHLNLALLSVNKVERETNKVSK